MCMQFISFFEKFLRPRIQGNNGTKSVNSTVESLNRSYCLYAKRCKCLICTWRHFVKLKTAATAAPTVPLTDTDPAEGLPRYPAGHLSLFISAFICVVYPVGYVKQIPFRKIVFFFYYFIFFESKNAFELVVRRVLAIRWPIMYSSWQKKW